MTNVNSLINPENPDEITVDISGITSEQRRLLKLAVLYPETIPNPNFDPEVEVSEENPMTIPNDTPLVAWMLKKSIERCVHDMKHFEKEERKAELEETPSVVDGMQ